MTTLIKTDVEEAQALWELGVTVYECPDKRRQYGSKKDGCWALDDMRWWGKTIPDFYVEVE